jgi:hypothetical protein
LPAPLVAPRGADAPADAPAAARCRRRSGQQLAVLPGVLLPAQFSWVYSLAMTTLLVGGARGGGGPAGGGPGGSGDG